VIRPRDQFGPWVPDLDRAELRARLRAMRALARVLCGPRATDLVRLLAQAEADATALEPALAALDRLPSSDRRHLLGSYAALHRPAA
jgi:hypothetical protein